ncbi:MAG: hypothetical protein AB1467_06690 [Candidatus Diapherotrites archaeon]
MTGIELKTLKEIIPWDTKVVKGAKNIQEMLGNVFSGNDYENSYAESNLRQEAINWIKEFRDYKTEHALSLDERIAMTGWIKHFFNLKEEDLK